MKRKKLSEQEQAFVDHYLVSLSPIKAARLAGYSEATARTAAYGWVNDRNQKPRLFDEIRARLKERREILGVDAMWVMQRLIQEVEADMSDLFETDGTMKDVSDWPEVWRTGLVSSFTVTETTKDGVKTGEIKRVRLTDRGKRLELLGKHADVRAFSEVLAGDPNHPIAPSVEMSDKEVARRVAFILAKALNGEGDEA